MAIGLRGPRYRSLPGRWQRAGIQAKASLTNQDITYTAVTPGTGGNGITITILGGGPASRALGVTVSGKAITVAPATDGDGVITSTRTAVRNAVNGHAPAAALVTAAGTSATTVAALAATPLSGGKSYTIGSGR